MIEYSIARAHNPEKGQNEFDTVIHMANLSSEVTIDSLLDHLEKTEKTMREQLGQVEVNKILMEKAIEALPMLKDIPEDKIGLAFSYVNKMSANKIALETIDTCEKTIEVYRTHLKGIEEATGIKCVPEVSPIQLKDIRDNA